MLVMVLHGFGTTGDGDELCQEIVHLVEEHDSVGLAPTYPTNNPHLANMRLTDYADSKMRYYDTDAVFVGVSLGGFWARHLARTYGAARLILINPSLSPWESLQPYVGKNKNSANEHTFELSVNDTNAYYIYRGDDSKTSIEKVKTDLIATDSSNQTIIEKFTDKRNVDVHIVHEYDEILPIIKEALFPEEDESEDS